MRQTLVGLVLASLALQAAAMHPDVLTFLRGPAPSLETEATAQTGRRLQQTFGEAPQPFTFDGFGFGTGGWYPGGGLFDGFATNIYNIVFRDILNTGLTEYVARALPNDLGNPLNFIPPDVAGFPLGTRLGRDVVSVFGFDWFDRYIQQYYTYATASQGKLVNAGCVGPKYGLTVNGGECEIMDDGSVECTNPSIVLKGTPLTCNLPYRAAAALEGAGWQYRATFGQAREGVLGPPASQYNFGAAVNITNPYLGFNAQLNRIANDFGVQQWWQFTGQLIINELVRIQAALVSGDVDRRIYTRELNDRAAALGFRPVPDPGARRHLLAGEATAAAAAAAAGSGIAAGIDALRSAGSTLMQRVAQRMGLSVADLIDGLRAAGVPVPGSEQSLTRMNLAAAPRQQQQQQAKAQAAADVSQDLSSLVTFAELADASATPDATAPAVAPEAALREFAASVPAASQVISQTTNESEGDAAMLAQLNQGLAADRAAAVGARTGAQEQFMQPEPVGPVLSQQPASG
ncbi:hypothetical protein OEZ86_011975 [Tetradesmus obliquus]|nr:hypothetical protein OEZ86_011975 [Tetradesmus obliquus]